MPREARPKTPYNPFLSHDFLWSLEEAGCAIDQAGWFPRHLVLDRPDGTPAAAMPCYVKTHSQGEFVFDHGWADAFERAGGSYYPKLQSSIPFTPVTGRRLLVADGPDAGHNRALLAAGGRQLTEQIDLSSLHVTFAERDEWELLGEAGYLQRTDQQYHFVNDGYRDFTDFLDSLAARKRKAIRRERRCTDDEGLEIVRLTGSDLDEAAWDAFYDFYMDTGARKWGRPYLNRTFFSLIGERMADRLLLVLARREGRYVAGALNAIGSDTLYGRYWGATENIRLAGAQGEHKLARGYRPTITYSAHWIRNRSFRRAVADYLEQERRQVAADNEALADYLPFRQNVGDENDGNGETS